jgi:hypothetical protein
MHHVWVQLLGDLWRVVNSFTHAARILVTRSSSECYSKINKFEKLMRLVGFTIEIYYDALTYERRIYQATHLVPLLWKTGDCGFSHFPCHLHLTSCFCLICNGNDEGISVVHFTF